MDTCAIDRYEVGLVVFFLKINARWEKFENLRRAETSVFDALTS